MVTGPRQVRWQRTVLALSLVAGTASVPMLASATDVYRWVDPAGTVHFGDRPPGNRSVERVEIQPPSGALPLPNAEEILRRPVRPEARPERAEERPEASEPEAEEFIRDRRSLRGR